MNSTAPPAETPTSFPTQFAPITSNDLGISLAAYLVGGSLLFGLYLILQRHCKYTYFPKAYNKDLKLSSNTRSPPPDSIFRCVLDAFHSDYDKDILLEVGFDAYVMIRVLRFGLKFFTYLTPFLFIIYVPIYATQGYLSDSRDVEIISLSNVPSHENWVFWICCFGVYAISAFAIWLLRSEYLDFISMRHNLYLSSDKYAYTILVERIPPSLASHDALKRYFEAIIGDVVAVEVVPSDNMLQELNSRIGEREDVLMRLERAIYDERESDKVSTHLVFFQDETGREKQCCGCSLSSRTFCYGWCCYAFHDGELVESKVFYAKKLDELNELIPSLKQDLQRQLDEENRIFYESLPSPESLKSSAENNRGVFEVPNTEYALFKTDPKVLEEAIWLLDNESRDKPNVLRKSAAFITFRTKIASTVISRVPINEVETSMFVKLAKDPKDILWENVGFDKALKWLISGVVIVLDLILLVTFGVLTSTISATTQLESIRRGWPALDELLNEFPWLTVLFAQIAPLLIVIIFALVPPVQLLIIQLHKPSSFSSQDRWFFGYYFIFQVVQIFLFYQISGSIYLLVFQVYEDPWQGIRILAAQIPTNATFYMQYILLRALLLMPLDLLRVSDLAVAYLVRPIFCGSSKTKRERRSQPCGCNTIEYPGDPWHARSLSQIMLVFTMGIVYCLMAPLVVPIVAIYALSTLLSQQHQLRYVYVPMYESGGSFWKLVARSFMFAIILFQVTMMGIFLLNNQPVCTALMIPAIIITSVFARYMDSTYGNNMDTLSMATAKAFDMRRILEMHKETDNFYEEKKAIYKHPLLVKPDREDMDEDIRADHEPAITFNQQHASNLSRT